MDKESKSYFSKNKNSKIFGLTLIVFAVIILLSIISYLIFFRADQSLAIGGWEQIKKVDYYKTQNWINKIGLFIGYFFVDVLFGVFSICIPIVLLLYGINFAFQRRVFGFFSTFRNAILLIILGSSFFALWQNIFNSIHVPLGGGFGYYLAGKEGVLYPLIGFIGVFLLWVLVTLASFIWLFDFDFTKLFNLKEEFNKIKKQSKQDQKSNLENFDEELPAKHYDTLFEQDHIQIEPKTEVQDSMEMDIISVHDATEENDIESTFEVIMPQEEMISNFDENPLIEIEFNEDNIIEDADEHQQERFENLPPYDPRKELSNYQFPSIELMANHGHGKTIIDKEQLDLNKNQIIRTLNDFNITITSIRATVGPTVTLYEITPSPGIRISKIKSLEDDIALSLAALGIRIIAPIPGKGTIGIEVPNLHKQIVSMKSVIQSEKFQNSNMELPLALGKNISNEVFVADLAKMPHLLMAGATGKGKSVGINSILVSLLYKKHPAELKFVLVDPKKVELSIYSTIEKHYLAKLPNEEDAIITDVKKVVNTLNSLCIEMDDRYDLLKKAQVRNIKEYNEKFISRKLSPLNGHRFLPYFVLIIDEFADLIMTAGKEVELPIARLAQLARAIGIHLIVATQRPSVNVITGLIKANFPARISFAVSSSIDSKTILDTKGAEQLIGQGDMLLSLGSEIVRLQCAFIDTPEVDAIGRHIAQQQSYSSAYDLPEYYGEDDLPMLKFDKKDIDELFKEAAREIVLSQMGSISLIQRKLSIGHNRAGRIIDQLEAFGVVGPNKGSKPREVYFKSLDELERHLETLN